MKLISIVTPCYNEEDGILDCYHAVKASLKNLSSKYSFEHIFCDNASTDNTFSILTNLAHNDSSVKVIRNSRNYGIFKNAYNGVLNANGDAVLLMLPADLQDPPSLLPHFIDLWENGYQIVYGTRDKRDESFILRTLRFAYYRLLSSISNINYPPNAGDFQLVDRIVIDHMTKTYVADPFMRMSTFDCGFDSIGVSYRWSKRLHGKSKNTLPNLLTQGFDGIISFSTVPIRLTSLLGLTFSFLSLLFAIVIPVLVLSGLLPAGQRGFLTLFVGLFFLGSINLLALGVIGEYISRILNQVRHKPIVIERNRINF